MTRVGIVTIRKLDDDQWQLRYVDPHTRRDVRRRITGYGEQEVREFAKNVSLLAHEKKGLAPASIPTLRAALRQALASTRASEKVNAERERLAGKFFTWIGEKYPAVTNWADLKPHMVKEYMIELERAGAAFDTVRLKLAPIKLTWTHMAENYPDAVRPLPRIKQAGSAPLAIDCLTGEELMALLAWMKPTVPDLWPMAALLGLAGLRVMEAASVRHEDLKAGVLQVTDNSIHKLKTKASRRDLPLAPYVAKALATLPKSKGWIFLNVRGDHYTQMGLSQRWRRVMERASRELKNPRYESIPVRKLRAAFATIAGQQGVPDRLLQPYLGHSSSTVLRRHYQHVWLDDLREVPKIIEKWVRKSGNNQEKIKKGQ